MIGRRPSPLKHLTTEALAAALLGLALLGPASAGGSSPKGSSPAAQGGSATAVADRNDLRGLLPLLLTSPNRKQLAAHLEAAMRRGDMKAAETVLNTAIEVGTLAIALSDYLDDPGLLGTLQDLDIQSALAPSPAPASSSAAQACPILPETTSHNLAALQEALEREQSLGSMISQTLATLMQDHNALAARFETETQAKALLVSELRQALQREQDRTAVAERELQKLHGEYRALQEAKDQTTASAARSADMEALLQQERERGADAARQLAGLQRELQDLRHARDTQAAQTSELERALARAQMRGDALAQELAQAGEELRAAQALRQAGPTPVMMRLAAAGSEPSFPPPEAAPSAAATGPVEAKSSSEQSRPAPREIPPALSRQETGSVVVASLPSGIDPLPLAPERPKTEVQAAAPRAEPAAEPPKADDRLVARAEELLGKGDVSGARLLLERALASGHARAAFLLAETFDPNALSRLGALGLRGDAGKAREFYARAQALGLAQAGERLEALK